jgi:hypothetical protein
MRAEITTRGRSRHRQCRGNVVNEVVGWVSGASTRLRPNPYRTEHNMFDALQMLRDLRDDDQLTTTEFAVLLSAALRTDRGTCRVRASQAQLAEDAKVSLATIKRIYRSEEFRKWFATSRRGQQLILTWLSSDDRQGVSQGVTQGVTVAPLLLSTTTPSLSHLDQRVSTTTLVETKTCAPRAPRTEDYQTEEEWHLAFKEYLRGSGGGLTSQVAGE